MNKQIKLYAVIFCVCLFAASVLFTFQDKSPKRHSISQLFNLEVDDIHSFEVHHFASAFRFEKIKGRWHSKKIYSKLAKKIQKEKNQDVGIEDKNYRAVNDVEVTKALAYLVAQTNRDTISLNQTSPDIYEINPFSLQVILFDRTNNELGHVFIGKDGPDPMTSFIKLKDNNNVYLANQNFRLLFFRSIEEWRNPLKMPKIDTQQFTKTK